MVVIEAIAQALKVIDSHDVASMRRSFLMEDNGGRRLGWIAIALGGLALFVALSGRMQSNWGHYYGPRGGFAPPAYQYGPGQQGQFGPDFFHSRLIVRWTGEL